MLKFFFSYATIAMIRSQTDPNVCSIVATLSVALAKQVIIMAAKLPSAITDYKSVTIRCCLAEITCTLHDIIIMLCLRYPNSIWEKEINI